MDPYDLPDEFSHLQAQDMSKLGFMQDLIRGIKKLAAAAAEEARAAKLREKAALLLLAGLAVVIAILLVVFQVIVPSVRYRSAEKLLAAGDYTGAIEAFEAPITRILPLLCAMRRRKYCWKQRITPAR